MTSDAKVGLLLGLVFIFIIAFIINGLPSFLDRQNSNELTTNMAKPSSRSHGIGTQARKVTREVITPIEPVVKKTEIKPQIDTLNQRAAPQEVRFAADLPKPSEPVRIYEPAGPSFTNVPVVEVKRKSIVQAKAQRRALRKIHVVQEGDSLALIAKEYYGEEEGNKRANIARIFNANRRTVKSADQIYVGQRIIIPNLSVSGQQEQKVASVLATEKFEEVESVGRRRRPVENVKQKRHGYYVVKEGDNLWRIATDKLGNGNRYTEIAKLNAAVLEDEDSLAVGMRLKLPAR